MNTITLTGRLTADPELRTLPNDTKACQLRLAVEGMGRGNEVGYVDVVSYGPGGAAAAQVLEKGWLVAVTGRLEWRSWEKDDTKRQAHRVVGQIEFLAAPKGNSDVEAPPAERAAVGASRGDAHTPFPPTTAGAPPGAPAS